MLDLSSCFLCLSFATEVDTSDFDLSFSDPPSIEVSGINVSSVSESVSLNCLAISGNPDNYTFSQWQHRWPAQSGNILRKVESTSIEKNRATLKLENATFQDSGYYKCLTSNGIGTPENKDYKAERDVFILIKGEFKDIHYNNLISVCGMYRQICPSGLAG